VFPDGLSCEARYLFDQGVDIQGGELKYHPEVDHAQ